MTPCPSRNRSGSRPVIDHLHRLLLVGHRETTPWCPRPRTIVPSSTRPPSRMRWPGRNGRLLQIGGHVEIRGLLAERGKGQRRGKRQEAHARRRSPPAVSACASSASSSSQPERGRERLQLAWLPRCPPPAPRHRAASASRAASVLPSTCIGTHEPLPAFRIARICLQLFVELGDHRLDHRVAVLRRHLRRRVDIVLARARSRPAPPAAANRRLGFGQRLVDRRQPRRIRPAARPASPSRPPPPPRAALLGQRAGQEECGLGMAGLELQRALERRLARRP